MIPYIPTFKQAFFTLILTLSFFRLVGVKAQPICQTPPSTETMNQMFMDSLKKTPLENKTRLLVLPFQDGSQLLSADTALSKTFVFSLYDLISPLPQAALYHPYVAFNTTQTLSNGDLFDENKTVVLAKDLKATHLVLGMFQKNQGNFIRLFIKIIDISTGKPMGAPLEFTLTETDRFFSIMGDVSQTILSVTTGKKPQKNLFTHYLSRSPSFEAYRFYVKGMEKATGYNPVDLQVAVAWLEKAAALSYGFMDAYAEKKRVLWMSTVYNKQMYKDVSLLLADANALNIPINESQKKSGLNSKLTYDRWKKASELASGSTVTDPKQAVNLLTMAVALTPEDGLIQYELAQRLKQIGNQNSDAAKQASALNPCLKQL
ncbi:MAG: hypothetical protein ACD_73C00392G0001 [uncultured bacterium]|nr:MAG: hypothetical protein ACD_73C00392G0001 [uncultured bacterium]